ncbi:MAG: serine hydrolase domain-containing protein, partial [Bacillota bacterium]
MPKRHRSLASMDKVSALNPALALVQCAVNERQIPGAVARILHHGETVGEICCGWAHTVPPLPMAYETVFDLASLTKVVATVSAIVVLVQDGRLRIDTAVSEYLPQFSGDGRERVTIAHLLSHTAGLPATRVYADLGLSGRQAVLDDICGLALTEIGG